MCIHFSRAGFCYGQCGRLPRAQFIWGRKKKSPVSTHCGSCPNLYFCRTPHWSSAQLERQLDVDAALK
ncbi:Hypothetical protein FKW44_018950 [Caligus rogercresseyi]|uniref:Uncharacterized protein n=1 Tax=Caligus rogercresseyi TaxID=217165 RepID=A0A7T8GVM1_CALRO|nr:Hypothetical protein FKW44_018950 [Caligus rogercresseyi]